MAKINVFDSPALRAWLDHHFLLIDMPCLIPMETAEVIEGNSLVYREMWWGKFNNETDFYFLTYSEVTIITQGTNGGLSFSEHAVYTVSTVPPAYIESKGRLRLSIGPTVAELNFSNTDGEVSVSHTPDNRLANAPRRIQAAFHALLRNLSRELQGKPGHKLVPA